MYEYLYFGLALVCIFSIIENFKNGQNLTFFKINIFIFLLVLTTSNIFDFLFELGHEFKDTITFVRLLGSFSFINLFYLVAMNKIPKLVLFIEVVFMILILILMLYGFQFVSINNGVLISDITKINLIAISFVDAFLVFSMVLNLSIIFKKANNDNLYHKKILKWAFILIFILIITVLIISSFILLHFKKVDSTFIDSRLSYIISRSLILLFILLRPKFIDESGFSIGFNTQNLPKTKISVSNFEYLFYHNHYYLLQDANVDDFALKLNHTKVDVLEFLKSQSDDTFIELINKKRIDYLLDMLKSKKYKSFTIEALSEMAGFGNRRSMYYAFQKYVGVTPTEYINNLK